METNSQKSNSKIVGRVADLVKRIVNDQSASHRIDISLVNIGKYWISVVIIDKSLVLTAEGKSLEEVLNMVNRLILSNSKP